MSGVDCAQLCMEKEKGARLTASYAVSRVVDVISFIYLKIGLQYQSTHQR